MNKSELIALVAEKSTDLESKAAAGRVVDLVQEAIVSTLAEGGEFSWSGIGTFYVVAREAREGRNPQTGEAIQIPAKNVPKARFAKGLKDTVNA